ncbi:hypothetical protein CEXT_682141 [Caerostris extrusa]|uniref:Uncharacterized protein n=1 Tax=Caerostris extrusa TaxID=172846 RepID=A0AAV4UFD9_CAEEX|nr:hypothetical protein CEXT_682141 [Caerostris extrusa]
MPKKLYICDSRETCALLYCPINVDFTDMYVTWKNRPAGSLIVRILPLTASWYLYGTSPMSGVTGDGSHNGRRRFRGFSEADIVELKADKELDEDDLVHIINETNYRHRDPDEEESESVTAKSHP